MSAKSPASKKSPSATHGPAACNTKKVGTKDCPEHGEVLERSGITALAAGSGADPDELLAVMAMLMCGAAGPEARWGGSAETAVPLAKFDLLARAEDEGLRRALDRLLASLRVLNNSLAARSACLSPDLLGIMLQGDASGRRAAKAVADKDMAAARERLVAALRSDSSSGQGLLEMGEEPVMQPEGIESVLHPEFLIERARAADLPRMLDRCHLRCGIVAVPRFDSDRAGPAPLRDLRQLLELMEGVVLPRFPTVPGRAASLPFKAHTLLLAEAGDRALIAGALPRMARRFIWLKGPPREVMPAPGAMKATPEHFARREAAVGDLMRGFDAAVHGILRQRKLGYNPCAHFQRPEQRLAHELGLSRHRDMLREHAGKMHLEDPGAVAANLPTVLCWALLWLFLEMPVSKRVSDEAILKAAMESARRLAAAHCEVLSKLLNEERINRRMQDAARILDAVDRKGPLGNRDLMRSLSGQHKDRYMPVVEALLEVGLLARDDAGALITGRAEWDHVEESLKNLLAAL